MSGIAGTGFTVLDLVLVLVGASFAVSGYRQGLVAGVLAVAGFIVGGAVGMGAGPRVVQTLEPGLTQSLVSVLVVLAIAAVGHAIGASLGRWLRARMTWHPVRVFDSGLGAVVSVAAVLVVMWFVAGALRASPVPAISAAIRSSTIVTGVDEVMPEYARGLFGSFRDLLREDNLPRVFGGLAPERISPVAPPDLVRAQTPQIAEAARSVVRVTGAAQSCRRAVSGLRLRRTPPSRVMTNAHVVAGVEHRRSRSGSGRLLARPWWCSTPDRDIAVLAVPGLEAPPLTLGGPARAGDDAVVAGFPGGRAVLRAPGPRPGAHRRARPGHLRRRAR